MASLGVMVDNWAVEQAALAVLQNPPPGGYGPRIVYYIADRERDLGLDPRALQTPPGPSSYRGGVDAMTGQYEWCPMFHVVVSPADAAERQDRYTYAQAFRLDVTATCGDDDEDVARMNANALGIAAVKALADNGSLGIGATDTQIVEWPRLSVMALSSRQVIRATAILQTHIAPALTVGLPPSWAADPYDAPAALPTVETIGVSVAEPS